MLTKVFVCAALAVYCLAAAQTQAPMPRYWIDLFDPPYIGVPEIIMSIGCVSGKFCVVPAESNGAGPSVNTFNGERNSRFYPMTVQGGEGNTFNQFIGVGGSESALHGAVLGVEFGGLPHYIVNKSYLAEALSIPFIGTISVSADRATGKIVAFANEFAAEVSLSVSYDGGATYTSKTMNGNRPLNNCTFARYQTIVDKDVMYVTFGSDPSNQTKQTRKQKKFNLDGEEIVMRTSPVTHVARDRATNKLKNVFEAPKPHVGESGCPYTAAIMKTVDGGNSWTTVFASIGEGYEMNYIDCLNATHCVATADGYDEGAQNVAHVFTTTDGKTFKKTLTLNSVPGESAVYVSALQYVPGHSGQIWVAAVNQSRSGYVATFYGSSDYGTTWTKHESDNFIGAVTSMSCAADGNCFASAITAMRVATVLRYDSNGVPATPAPVYNGNITEKVCQFGTCSTNCTTKSFAQNSCRKINAIASERTHCDIIDKVVVKRVFIGSDSCASDVPQREELVPIDQCLEIQKGGSMMVTC